MPTKAPADSVQMQRKSAVIDDIRARLESADAAVLTEYRGLTVTDIAVLRAALRPAATDYKIFKNTLARRAAHDAGLDDIVESFEGPIAIAFVRGDGGDAVTAAKALRDFARTNPNLVLKGGILGTRILSTRDVEALADVPPRDQLLARLAGGFQAPMVKAAGLFQAFTRNMAYGVKALIDQRIAAGEALPAEPPAPEPEPSAAEPEAAVAEPTEIEAPAAEVTEPAPESETPAEAPGNEE
jgi:large subunit ribosomal protein L10